MDNKYPVKILIVDDKSENIIALKALLERPDVDLLSTTSPNEALRLCWDQDIAIALIDVQMPEMDGFELAEILKSNSRTRNIIIIFVTAISKETKYAVKGLSAGAVDYLYKPLDPYITTAKVDSFIRLVQAQYEIRLKNQELETYQAQLLAAKERAEVEKKNKEDFLASMSHEIRTPVNSILGLTHLLNNTGLDEEQKKLVHLLKLSGESLSGIVNDILDLSKIEAGKFKIVKTKTNIWKLLQELIELHKLKAAEKNLSISLIIDPRLPREIITDPLRMNQILTNLVSNAIKFTDKGEVIVKVSVINIYPQYVEIEFSVKDTGIGISKDKLHLIFNSFEQADDLTERKYGGTGLGLTIVKKLAELKGGTLKVESKEGEGSMFSFVNQYHYTNPTEKTEGEPAERLQSFENIRVLLAEDNLVNQFMVKKVLSNWNIEVDAVNDGNSALENFREKHYDLILMDTHMPFLNGYEAIRSIRGEFPLGKKDIPIISLSANVLDEEIQAAYDAGANDVLTKPFEPAALHRKITALISCTLNK